MAGQLAADRKHHGPVAADEDRERRLIAIADETAEQLAVAGRGEVGVFEVPENLRRPRSGHRSCSSAPPGTSRSWVSASRERDCTPSRLRLRGPAPSRKRLYNLLMDDRLVLT